jgi:HEAT repeat protein
LSFRDSPEYWVLMSTGTFHGAHVGFGLDLSHEAIALRRILDSPCADAVFKDLLEQGENTTVKLYALCGLYFTDHKAFEKALAPYLESDEDVRYQWGCIVDRRLVKDLARDLANGELPNDLRFEPQPDGDTEATHSEGLNPSLPADWRRAVARGELSAEDACSRLADLGPRGVLALETLLADADPELRAAAAGAFVAFGPLAAEAAPSFARLLLDPDLNVREQGFLAVMSLGAWARPIVPEIGRAIPQLLEDVLSRRRAKDAEDWRVLDIPTEDGTDPEYVLCLVLLLGRVGPSALPELQSLLGHGEALIRLHALWALRELREHAAPAQPAVAALLCDSEPEVRAAAAGTLVGLRTETQQLVVPLINSLRDPDPRVRAAAAGSLGRLGTAASNALPMLRWMAQDEIAPRAEAKLALWQITGELEGLVTALLDLFEEEHYDELEIPIYPPDVLVDVARKSPETVPQIAEYVRRAEGKAQSAAVNVLDRLGPAAAPALPVLRDAVGEPDAAVRRAAVEALGRLGPDARPALRAVLDALEDNDAGVRFAALNAREAIERDPDAAPAQK